MEKEKTIFDYIMQTLCIFGFAMLCMMCFVRLFGESAKGYASFFSLGKEGVPIGIMLQIFVLAGIIEFLIFLFQTDRVIKKISVLKRTIYMVLAVMIVIILFIILFRWFPIHMWQPWLNFFICYAICFFGSFMLAYLKNKIENKKLAKGLEKLKKEWESEKNGSDCDRAYKDEL